MYSTTQTLIDRFGEDELIQITDRNNSGQLDHAVLERANNDATGEIDGFLGDRYTLPLASVPRILNVYAADIARYKLYDDGAPEQVQKRYDHAIRMLELIASGKVSLGATPGGDQITTEPQDVQMDTGRRVMPGGGF